MTIMAERPLALRTRRPDTEPEPATPPAPVEPEQPAAVRTHKMILIDPNSTEIPWNPGDPAQVAEARQQFAQMQQRGHLAYRIDADGGHSMLREFDENAQEIMFAPQLQGG